MQAVEQPPQQPPQPPPQPEPQPWGGRPWGQQAPRPQPPPPQWGERPAPRQPWGYRPPPEGKAPRPGGPPPWWRQPVGLLLIGAAVVTVLALVVPAFTGGGEDPGPTVTTGAFGAPGTTAPPPAATTTTSGRPPTASEQLGQAVQDELGTAGEVVSVTAPTGSPVTVTWEITKAGSPGLTRNNARFGVMRALRAIQQTAASAGGDAPAVRLIGRYQLAGSASPVTVVRLRFDPSTVERGEFNDRRYLEAFELADAAVIHPTFRG